MWKEPDIVTRLQKASKGEDLYWEAAHYINKLRQKDRAQRAMLDIYTDHTELPGEAEEDDGSIEEILR